MGVGLGVALSAGCRDDGGGGSSGTLGYADFRWQCAGPGDVMCASGRADGFPRTVALGSEFELGFVLVGVPSRVDPGWIELAGSSRAALLSSNRYDDGHGYGDDPEPEPTATLRADEVGSISLLALAQDETVADFVTLSIRPVTSLAVVLDCPDDVCEGDGEVVEEGRAGTSVALRVEPYGDGELLVGTLEYEWSSLDPEVAELGGDPTGNQARLYLRREGTAYVRVRTGDVEDTVAVTVTSNGPRRTRPGPGGGETETDTDTDTDGHTDSTGTTGSGTDTDASTDTDTDAGTGTSTGGMQ